MFPSGTVCNSSAHCLECVFTNAAELLFREPDKTGKIEPGKNQRPEEKQNTREQSMVSLIPQRGAPRLKGFNYCSWPEEKGMNGQV